MKKFFSAAIILMSVFTPAFAQTVNQRQIDSAQTRIMKDSLQISDGQIRQLFEIRDSMAAETVKLRGDTSLADTIAAVQIASIRNAATTRIREALGNEKYKQYTDMVRRWVSRRASQSTAPLAEGDQ